MQDSLTDNKGLYDKKTRIEIVTGVFGVFFIAVALVGAWTLHSNNAKSSENVAVVHITRNGFQPATVVVNQGTKVVWMSDDSDLHQIQANPFPSGGSLPALKSEILNRQQSYSFTPTKTGSFGYHDQLAPTINGTLVVQRH